MKTITMNTLVRRFWLDTLDKYDVVMVIDGSDDNRHGPVGLGKSSLLIQLVVRTSPRATIARNVVLKDDEERYMELLNDSAKYTVIGVDEAEWFYYKRQAMTKGQKHRVMQFMTNRKECKYHYLALPRIWDMDPYFRTYRVQWRLKVTDRGEAWLYVRNAPAKWDEKKDIWGFHVATFYDIPDSPPWLWNEYQRCVDGYVPARMDETRKRLLRPAERVPDIWEPPGFPEGPLSPEDLSDPVR